MENATKQIQYIEQMIATAQNNLAESSIYYLIWGWLVFIAAAINYCLLVFSSYSNSWIAWPILMTLGAVISIIAGYKKSTTNKVKTKIDQMLIYLWLGFGITLLVVLTGMGSIGAIAIYPLLMALYGLGTFVSGSILNYKPLQVGAVASWVCASIAFYQVDFANQLILIATAILFSYIIPGHLLAAKK